MSMILLRSGQYFDLLKPDPLQVDIADIAHALGNLCRFTGHTRTFYSVAQHSVFVSRIVPPEFALEALMHDAHEAYVADVAAPLKSLIPDYRRMERRVATAVRQAFLLPIELSEVVCRADLVALATERRDLMPNDARQWPILAGVEPDPLPLSPDSPGWSTDAFLARFQELTEGT